MITTDKPKDADILERVKDILNKKKEKIIMARSCKLLRGRVLICVTFAEICNSKFILKNEII